MRVLLAFDKFKDALSAQAACDTVREALAGKYQVDSCPLADGGEGFCEILTHAAGGRRVERTVTGPRGEPVHAGYGIAPIVNIPGVARKMLGLADRAGGNVAVIEMAQASGLALLPLDGRDPWQATTFGTGELISAASAEGVEYILLGIGGSATHDLGLGAIAALGVKGIRGDGAAVAPPIPARWPEILSFRGSLAGKIPRIGIACDVTNPLLGPRGAAAVYGPQKGLKPQDYTRMEAESSRLSQLLCRDLGRPLSLRETPGTGAAGGISFGLMCAADAHLLPGFELVSAWFDLEERIAAADIVITGEGRFDESSLQGKGPGSIVRRALELGKKVHVFAGSVPAMTLPPGLHARGISPAGLPLPEALRTTRQNLARSVRETLG